MTGQVASEEPRPTSTSRQPVLPCRVISRPLWRISIQPRPSPFWSRPRSRPVISDRRRPPAKPTSSLARSRIPGRPPPVQRLKHGNQVFRQQSFFLPGRGRMRVADAGHDVAMALSLRSSIMPRWTAFQPMAERRRSMVETLFGFAPRSAAPDAQAVTYRPTTCGSGEGEIFWRRHQAASVSSRWHGRGGCWRNPRTRRNRGRDRSDPAGEPGRQSALAHKPPARKHHQKPPCCLTALSAPGCCF